MPRSDVLNRSILYYNILAALPNDKFEKESILNIIKKQKELNTEVFEAYLISIDQIHKNCLSVA